MSFEFRSTLLFALALPLAACSSHQASSASHSPDDTLRDGTPPGDHTGADPTNRSKAADENAASETGSGAPGPGWSAAPQDQPTPVTGGSADPNAAAPGASTDPGR